METMSPEDASTQKSQPTSPNTSGGVSPDMPLDGSGEMINGQWYSTEELDALTARHRASARFFHMLHEEGL